MQVSWIKHLFHRKKYTQRAGYFKDLRIKVTILQIAKCNNNILKKQKHPTQSVI